MILQRNVNVFKNYHLNEGSRCVERKIKLMDIGEWRRLVTCNLGRSDRSAQIAGLKKLIQQQEAGRQPSNCGQKRFSLVLRSTSRAGASSRRLRNEVAIPRASDLEGVAKEILTTSGLATNFQLTLKDGKGNSLTLAWTHIDPDETEARQSKRGGRTKPDREMAKKKQLVEGDFKQWLVAKLARGELHE